MIPFDDAHRAVHYPKDRRFRIRIRPSILILLIVLALVPLVLAWVQHAFFGLPYIAPSPASLEGAPSGPHGFPVWIRWSHFFNLIFLFMLMRSGLSLADASEWYVDVAQMMARHADSGALVVRFEEVVSQPMRACDQLYRDLSIRWAEDGRFDFKIKPYGDRRTDDVGVRDGEVVRIGAEDVGLHIDGAVLRGEKDRLSDDQRKAIWDLTGEMASRFGYEENGSC